MLREDPLKAEKDFSATLDEQFPSIDVLAASDYKAAVDKLLLLEKQTRQLLDLALLKRTLIKMVDVLAAHGDWALLNEQVVLLSKKHGQLKNAVQAMVQAVMAHLDEIALDEKLTVESIENIRSVTENKIYVEVERARVLKRLLDLYFAKGDLDKALDILCDLQVETYGLMELKEKIEFILEQVNLTVLQKDFTQAKILSKKILVRLLAPFPALKYRYYRLMIEVALSDHDYLLVVRHYLSIIEFVKAEGEGEEEEAVGSVPPADGDGDVELVDADADPATITPVLDQETYQKLLVAVIYFVVLLPYDNYQHDLIQKVKSNPVFAKVKPQFELVELFTTQELMRWPVLKENYDAILFQLEIFDRQDLARHGAKHYEDLRHRVIEHNLRVISAYYSQITTKRLTVLLDLSEHETEGFILELVTKGVIYAKIDRPARVVSFSKPKTLNELLNDWCSDIDLLLNHLETIGHLITKEDMMHQIKAQGA